MAWGEGNTIIYAEDWVMALQAELGIKQSPGGNIRSPVAKNMLFSWVMVSNSLEPVGLVR